MALAIGRRVRRETHVSQGARSYAYGAFSLLRDALGGVRQKTISLVGAHTLQERIAARCRAYGCRRLLITSHTCAHGGRLAMAQRGLCFPLMQLAQALALSDAVVLAVRAPAPLVTAAMLAPRTTLVVLDLSVPCAVADEVRALPFVRLLTLDDVLQRLVTARCRRHAAVPAADALIEQAVAALGTQWHPPEVAA
jgi:glutamyl-tRNA reductase